VHVQADVDDVSFLVRRSTRARSAATRQSINQSINQSTAKNHMEGKSLTYTSPHYKNFFNGILAYIKTYNSIIFTMSKYVKSNKMCLQHHITKLYAITPACHVTHLFSQSMQHCSIVGRLLPSRYAQTARGIHGKYTMSQNDRNNNYIQYYDQHKTVRLIL